MNKASLGSEKDLPICVGKSVSLLGHGWKCRLHPRTRVGEKEEAG